MNRIAASGTIPPEMLARQHELSVQKIAAIEDGLRDVKPKINELLYQVLPPKTTLEDMETLACAVWDLVAKQWEKSVI